jgi:hypothetical protein
LARRERRAAFFSSGVIWFSHLLSADASVVCESVAGARAACGRARASGRKRERSASEARAETRAEAEEARANERAKSSALEEKKAPNCQTTVGPQYRDRVTISFLHFLYFTTENDCVVIRTILFECCRQSDTSWRHLERVEVGARDALDRVAVEPGAQHAHLLERGARLTKHEHDDRGGSSGCGCV